MDLQQSLHKVCPPETLVLQGFHHPVGHSQIKVELRQLFVLQADVRRVIDNLISLLGLHQERLGALDIVVCIIFQGNINLLAPMNPLPEHIAVVVAVAVHNELGSKIPVGLSVHPQHPLISPGSGIYVQGLPVQILRHGVRPFEPAVDSLAFKDGAVRTLRKACLLRHAVVASVGQKGLHGHGVHHLKKPGLQHLLQTLQLAEHSVQLHFSIHSSSSCYSSTGYMIPFMAGPFPALFPVRA